MKLALLDTVRAALKKRLQKRSNGASRNNRRSVALQVEQLERRYVPTNVTTTFLLSGGAIWAVPIGQGQAGAVVRVSPVGGLGGAGPSEISASLVQANPTVFAKAGGAVWEHTGMDPNSGWTEIFKTGISSISAGVTGIGSNGATPTVFVQLQGAVWEHLGPDVNLGWYQVSGTGASQIAASQAQNDTVFIKFGGAVWEHIGLDQNQGWFRVSGPGASEISVSQGLLGQGQNAVYIRFGGAVWEHFGLDQNNGWYEVWASGATGISAGFYEYDYVLVNFGGVVWEKLDVSNTNNINAGWYEVWSGVSGVTGSYGQNDTSYVNVGGALWMHEGRDMNAGWIELYRNGVTQASEGGA